MKQGVVRSLILSNKFILAPEIQFAIKIPQSTTLKYHLINKVKINTKFPNFILIEVLNQNKYHTLSKKKFSRNSLYFDIV